VAISAAGPALEPGTLRELTFDGERTLVIAPGQGAVSDEVDLSVQRGDHLAISLYVVEADGPYSGHSEAKNVGYYSAPLTGDLTDELVSPALGIPTPAWTWVQAVDVLAEPRPVIVVLGDSVSDGFLSPEIRQEWPGRLAERLGDEAVVINNAIDASIATPTACGLCGPPLISRLHHDAIGLAGVTHVIVFLGVNDVTQLVSPTRITDAYAEAARRLHANGIEMILATLTPRYDVALGWDPEVHGPNRHRVNNWIRANEVLFDGIVDFDAALRWDLDPDRMQPAYDSGDNSHPNALGMQVLAEAVDVDLLDVSTNQPGTDSGS
jgi:lysophospholipase L1-like esterase